MIPRKQHVASTLQRQNMRLRRSLTFVQGICPRAIVGSIVTFLETWLTPTENRIKREKVTHLFLSPGEGHERSTLRPTSADFKLPSCRCLRSNTRAGCNLHRTRFTCPVWTA